MKEENCTEQYKGVIMLRKGKINDEDVFSEIRKGRQYFFSQMIVAMEVVSKFRTSSTYICEGQSNILEKL